MCGSCGGYGCVQCAPPSREVVELSPMEFVTSRPAADVAQTIGALLDEIGQMSTRIADLDAGIAERNEDLASMNASNEALLDAALTYRREREEARAKLAEHESPIASLDAQKWCIVFHAPDGTVGRTASSVYRAPYSDLGLAETVAERMNREAVSGQHYEVRPYDSANNAAVLYDGSLAH